jgi:hypothetical protein
MLKHKRQMQQSLFNKSDAKTFSCWSREFQAPMAQIRSLFAAFSAEKEDLS